MLTDRVDRSNIEITPSTTLFLLLLVFLGLHRAQLDPYGLVFGVQLPLYYLVHDSLGDKTEDGLDVLATLGRTLHE